MTGTILICPCLRWHLAPTIATEPYKKRFRCGLSVYLDKGYSEYKFKKKPMMIVDLATTKSHLIILLAR